MIRSESPSTRIRVLRASVVLSMRNFFADPQWIIPSIVAPFLFTLVSLFLFGSGSGSELLYVVIGGALMGMWGTTVYQSANSLAFDRWSGTLEATLSAPVSLVWVVFGRVIWYTLIGALNGCVILAVGLLWFRSQIVISNPTLFLLAALVTFVSLSGFGLMLTSVYVLTRKAIFLENAIELPLYLATGTMFPISLLPLTARGFSYALAPMWGTDALRIAGVVGYRGVGGGYWLDVLITLVGGAAYFGLSAKFFTWVERRSRTEGTLGYF